LVTLMETEHVGPFNLGNGACTGMASIPGFHFQKSLNCWMGSRIPIFLSGNQVAVISCR
jgi:hypothetical protein